MNEGQLPTVRYNAQRLAEDIAARGWSVDECARRARLSYRTLYRFLRGEVQTPRTLVRAAKALGTKPDSYVIREAARPEQEA